MRKVERGLDITTSICCWHLFHASSKENSKMLLSDRFRETQTVEEVEGEDEMMELRVEQEDVSFQTGKGI